MKSEIMFVEPEVEVIRFPRQDVITTSGVGGPGVVLPDDEWPAG